MSLVSFRQSYMHNHVVRVMHDNVAVRAHALDSTSHDESVVAIATANACACVCAAVRDACCTNCTACMSARVT
jgi:hypothetical protein